MVLHAFDPMEHTIAEFVSFCERLEYTEGTLDKSEGLATKSRRDSKNANTGQISAAKSTARGKKRTNEELFCEYHRVPGHSTGQCKVVLDQVKKMRTNYESHRSKNLTWRRGDSNDKKKTNNEVNEINLTDKIKAAIKEIMATSKKRKANDEEEENLNIEEFMNIELSDSGEESS
jgi:hypothetical protein